jgi:hypothetical protein
MKRSSWLLAACCAATLCLWVGTARAHNENFPFNSSSEGWTWGTIPPASGTATPYWDWYPSPSSYNGGLQAKLVASGSGAGAWTMSPCLDILQESQSQPYIHVDFEHYTKFPQGIFGQVQFRIDATGTSGFGAWQGIPTAAWDTSGHLAPSTGTSGLSPAPPLVNGGPGWPPTNDWLAFSGTNTSATVPSAQGSGPHVKSAFTLQWADYGLSNASQIQFQFMVGVDETVPPQSPETIIWELNQVMIDGAKVCAVPEPGTLTLAGVALACGLGGYARRRPRRNPVARQPDYGEATGPR